MTGRYQAYLEYKDSGFEWLGDIPASWSLSRHKYIASFHKGKNPEVLLDEQRVGTIRYLSMDYLRGNSEPMFAEVEKNSYLSKENQVLIIWDGSNAGEFVRGREGIVSSTMAASELISEINSYFYWYACVCLEPEMRRHAIGMGIPHVDGDELKGSTIPLPGISEQRNIANFLDHETAKIDTLIEKQQQLIKLLKEKRQAVISHAVTKGLNPDAPMRDSGVEWLEEVPAHWVVKRLKHISPKIGVGLVINPSTYTRNEGVYFIFGGDVKEYTFDLSKTRRISPEDSDGLLPSRLNHRDLVTIRVGYPGITAVVTEDLEGSNCASVIVIRRGKYNSDWLCAAMNVWVGRQQVDLASYGAAQKQFNVADAIDFVFPVPSENEQNEIAIFVENSLSRFNLLSNKSERQIELLNERRTALISAAVTGKIDVRNWQAPVKQERTKEAVA
ncbi:MAG: restriction endonuclease subunit S [Anaerolineae bacterium]|nr:restriction endonuclease subunit S [Anaerolineae bacterium]